MSAFSLRSSCTLFMAIALASSAYATSVDPALADAPFRDPKVPIEDRIEDLLGRMTLAEKIAQLQGIWQTKHLVQDAQGNFSASTAMKNFPDGIGQISRPGDRVGTAKPDGAVIAAGASANVVNRTGLEAANYANAAQKWAVEQTRLGIPLLLHEEALHGFVARGATSFPQAIALASSWDPALVEQVMSVAAREMRLRGANLALAPVVDIVRDPRWGRSEETFGEDPYLAGEIGLAAIRGLQGSTLPLAPNKVFATLKHLTGHGEPENGVNVGPAHVGERTLRENFLPPFEKAVRSLSIRSVMVSYNEIDGIPSHITVVARAGAQVKAALDATVELGGENYVFWGGREGYASLLNTDMKRELAHMGRFLTMARDYGRSIGFKGNFLIEPKPMEPMKHQYDFDSATVIGFLREHGLTQDFKLNIEANHATLSGHTFEHELQVASDAGLLGSIDANRGNPQNGWDTDQFPTDLYDTTAAMLVVLRQGGLAPGGLNFDAKVRRESSDPKDLFLAHIGGMDAFARGLEVAHSLLNHSPLEKWRQERYASFDAAAGKAYEAGLGSLTELREYALKQGEPEQRSGRQEAYENLFNQHLLR